jgi:hypothetical protein
MASKKTWIKMSIMLVISVIAIYIMYGTDLVSPTYSYVRLKDGTEFKNVSVKWTSDVDVRIDGKYYTNFDIDSLAR